jgi:hypothetical protein
MYAEVTYSGSPLAYMLVTFEARSPPNPIENITITRTAETNITGIAEASFRIPWPDQNPTSIVFGTWKIYASVEVAEIFAQDILSFKVGWIVNITSVETTDSELQPKTRFTKGSQMGLKLLLENIAMTTKKLTLVITVQDELNQPIAHLQTDDVEIPPGETSTYHELQIPKWANSGNATVYAAAYTSPPSMGGNPYCPEASTSFLIVCAHDVAVINVKPSVSEAYVGEQVNINVTVKNLGTETESFDVTVYCNSTAIQTLSVIGIIPNKERNLVFFWNTSCMDEGNYIIGAEASIVPNETNTDNNFCINGVVKVRRPPSQIVVDVAVVGVSVNATEAYVGQIVNVTVVVWNKGDADESFNVDVYYDSSLMRTLDVASLPPSYGRSLVFFWNTSNLLEGDYTIKARIPALPEEANTQNNEFIDGTIRITRQNVTIVDVAVVGVSVNATEAYVGQIVNVTVVVWNKGDGNESFSVKIYYNSSLMGTLNVSSLPPSSGQTLVFFWDTSNFVVGDYIVKACIPPLPREMNTENNEFINGTIRITEPPLFPRNVVLWLTMVLIALITTFILVTFLRRKRKKQTYKSHVEAMLVLHLKKTGNNQGGL